LHRTQWIGINGAPTTQVLSMHAPFFKKRVGLGLHIVRDVITITNNWNISTNYSYRIPVGLGHLSFGINASLKYLEADWNQTEALEIDDQSIPSQMANRFFPDMGAGVYYNTDRFYIGLSVQNLINAKVDFDASDVIDVIPRDDRHFFFMGGYVFNLTDNVKLHPIFLMKLVKDAPFDIDLNASLIFFDKLWAGVTWRKDDSIDGILQYQFTKQLRAGVAYDFTISELQQVNSGSFELMLEYNFDFDNGSINNIRYF